MILDHTQISTTEMNMDQKKQLFFYLHYILIQVFSDPKKYDVVFKSFDGEDIANTSSTSYPPPPYRLHIKSEIETNQDNNKSNDENGKSIVTVQGYRAPNMGPYPEDRPPKNTIK